MRELKMKRFKNYAAKLRATIRQIKKDGGGSAAVSREDIAQHVGGGDTKKEKVTARSFCFAGTFVPVIEWLFFRSGLKNLHGRCLLLRQSRCEPAPPPNLLLPAPVLHELYDKYLTASSG